MAQIETTDQKNVPENENSPYGAIHNHSILQIGKRVLVEAIFAAQFDCSKNDNSVSPQKVITKCKTRILSSVPPIRQFES
jgi:hypothetical protein